MLLRSDENDLSGAWILVDGQMEGDRVAKRIDRLIATHLRKIGASHEAGGWEALCRDPADGRFWELTFPLDHMHGGGPKRLTSLSPTDAKAKYRLSP